VFRLNVNVNVDDEHDSGMRKCASLVEALPENPKPQTHRRDPFCRVDRLSAARHRTGRVTPTGRDWQPFRQDGARPTRARHVMFVS
jgi:hypothetical protein